MEREGSERVIMSEFREIFTAKCCENHFNNKEEKEVLFKIIEGLDRLFVNLSGTIIEELDKASLKVLEERE